METISTLYCWVKMVQNWPKKWEDNEWKWSLWLSICVFFGQKWRSIINSDGSREVRLVDQYSSVKKKKKLLPPKPHHGQKNHSLFTFFLWTRLNTEKHHIRNILDYALFEVERLFILIDRTLVFLNHGLILQNRLNIKWLNCLIMLTWARYLNQGCVKLIRVHNFDWRRTRGFIDRCSQCYKTGTTFFF